MFDQQILDNATYRPARLETQTTTTTTLEGSIKGQEYHFSYHEPMTFEAFMTRLSEQNAVAYANAQRLVTEGVYTFYERTSTHDMVRRAEKKCCGEWITLWRFTNECPCCGTSYNGSGQRLELDTEWYETDEHPCDVRRIK